jgi:hypothetical protein
MKSGFDVWKAARDAGTPISKEDIYKQGLLNEGEYVPLDSYIEGRFRGSFTAGCQYKVYTPAGFSHCEAQLPYVLYRCMDVGPGNIGYKTSTIPTSAYGSWI